MAYIIKQSNGGLRNAISLFEQLIVNNTIDFSVVTQNF
jgi:DNA polymerase III gamma/tau subunit